MNKDDIYGEKKVVRDKLVYDKHHGNQRANNR